MANLWKSDRLIYRAIEDDDEPFISSLSADPEAYLQQMPFLPAPAGKKKVKSSREWYEEQMVCVVICLPPAAESASDKLAPPIDSNTPAKDDSPPKPTPVGIIFLFALPARESHHRRSEIGIGIAKAHQSKGYGGEAIKWILDFGFRRAALHRIALSAFSFNTRAIALYERLGFVEDCRMRDMYWHDGKFHDCVGLSMLEGEWRERYGGGK